MIGSEHHHGVVTSYALGPDRIIDSEPMSHHGAAHRSILQLRENPAPLAVRLLGPT